MQNFSFGIVSLALAVLFPIIYFFGFQIRRLSAWSKRSKGPTERVGFFIFLTAILGFLIGSFAQPLWDKGVECKVENKPLVQCILLQN